MYWKYIYEKRKRISQKIIGKLQNLIEKDKNPKLYFVSNYKGAIFKGTLRHRMSWSKNMEDISKPVLLVVTITLFHTSCLSIRNKKTMVCFSKNGWIKYFHIFHWY